MTFNIAPSRSNLINRLARLVAVEHPNASMRRGFVSQMRVISALMIREAMARFGHENLGFFWVIGEPLLLSCGVMVIWTLARQTHGSEVGVIPFALTGYTYITMWRHIVGKSLRLMTRNASLIFHSQVRFFDVSCAASLLEVLSVFAAFWVAYVPLSLLGFVPVIRDPLLLIGGWFLAGWFSFAFGLLLTGLSELSEAVEKFIPPAMYLTMPLTGTFFMLDWLPDRAQEIMSWSPLVNGCEMFRGGLFPLSVTTHWSAWYLVVWNVCLTCVALPISRYSQRHVQLY